MVTLYGDPVPLSGLYSTVTTEQLTSLVGAAARLEAKCKLSILYLFQGQKVSFQGHRADRVQYQGLSLKSGTVGTYGNLPIHIYGDIVFPYRKKDKF